MLFFNFTPILICFFFLYYLSIVQYLHKTLFFCWCLDSLFGGSSSTQQPPPPPPQLQYNEQYPHEYSKHHSGQIEHGGAVAMESDSSMQQHHHQLPGDEQSAPEPVGEAPDISEHQSLSSANENENEGMPPPPPAQSIPTHIHTDTNPSAQN